MIKTFIPEFYYAAEHNENRNENGKTAFFSSFFSSSICFRCPTSEHNTASLADEGNSVYCQSSCTHNIKHI